MIVFVAFTPDSCLVPVALDITLRVHCGLATPHDSLGRCPACGALPLRCLQLYLGPVLALVVAYQEPVLAQLLAPACAPESLLYAHCRAGWSRDLGPGLDPAF